MTDLEQRIIDMIEANDYLSEDLKKKYILALFLMSSEKQKVYLKLIQALDRKTKEADSGLYIIRADEMDDVKKDFDEVKRDILNKIQKKNKNNKN